MIGGYGWQQALRIMQALHGDDCATALALMDARHTEFATKRQQIQQTLEALRVISKETFVWKDIPSSRTSQIGEAAKQAGVRTSALHFWEQVGLLQPIRDRNSRYRLYDEQQLHRLRIIVLLREAGYRFDVIHAVLDEITSERVDRAIQAIEKRSEELTRMSWACVEATASFRDYVRDFYPTISDHPR